MTAILAVKNLTYKREMLARLIYPVANPSFSYLFCKGYYPRIADGKLRDRFVKSKSVSDLGAP